MIEEVAVLLTGLRRSSPGGAVGGAGLTGRALPASVAHLFDGLTKYQRYYQRHREERNQAKREDRRRAWRPATCPECSLPVPFRRQRFHAECVEVRTKRRAVEYRKANPEKVRAWKREWSRRRRKERDMTVLVAPR